MRLLDEQYTRTPFYGSRKMAGWLNTQGYPVERKRVRRLMQHGFGGDLPKAKDEFARADCAKRMVVLKKIMMNIPQKKRQ